jgi:S1-C subfamily serine protease
MPLYLAAAGGGVALLGLVVVLILVILPRGGDNNQQTAQGGQASGTSDDGKKGDAKTAAKDTKKTDSGKDAKATDEQQTKEEVKTIPTKKETKKPAGDSELVKKKPQPVEPPPEPLPENLATEMVKKVKRSTAYLYVTLPNGSHAEGSGFFAGDPGIVLTNAHVLGMLQIDGRQPTAVEVVINSGEPDEVRMAGKILGVDRASDLAVLRVDGDASKLPPPLRVDTAARLVETQKVYIFGFPLGSNLGKNITVSASSVSSLRRGDDGELSQVQVNGGMHPGNSGGPVTDTRGVVVGVSVAGIPGTQINFAIPGQFVKAVLEGRVSEHNVGEPYVDGGGQKLKVPVKLACLDPLKRIKQVQIDVWTGDPGKPRPPAVAAPEARPGDTERQAVAVLYLNGEGNADVPLPPLATGKVYWLQPVLTLGDAATRWGQATSFQPSTPTALERKAIQVQLKYPEQGKEVQRTLKLKAVAKITLSSGKMSKSQSQTFEADMLETLHGNPNGFGGINLYWANCNLFVELSGRKITAPPKLVTQLKRCNPRFAANPFGALKERADPNFKALPADVQEDVADMYSEICNAFEACCLNAPNRLVNPLDVWPTRQPMLIIEEGTKEMLDMILTCKYHGVRNNGGRNEAYYTVTGEVKGRDKRSNSAGGKVKGHALFDLDGGFLSEVKLRISSEMDLRGDLRLAMTKDIELTRTNGNTTGVTPPSPGGGGGGQKLVKGQTLFKADTEMRADDPKDARGCHFKVKEMQLTAGKIYIIEMKEINGSKIDPFLRLEDAQGKELAHDDDKGGGPNNHDALIIYRIERTANYRIVATSFMPGSLGPFALIVSEGIPK